MNEGADIARQERIEAYVAGRLTEADSRAFDALVAEDETLRADVEIERVLQETLRRGSELRFRDLVRHVSAEQEQGVARGGGAETPVIPIGSGRWRWWAVAASVAVVAGIAALRLNQPKSYDDRVLAYVSELELSGFRGDSGPMNHSDSLSIELIELRRNGNNEDFLRASGELLAGDSAFSIRYHDQTRLNRALVWLVERQPDHALKECQLIQDKRGYACELARIEGLAALLGGRQSEAIVKLQNAIEKGCMRTDELHTLVE